MTASTPRTPASKIRRTPSNTPGGPKVSEEKILVTVRLRPLSSKEQATYDLIAWDCTDDHTIVSRNLCHERHTGPYTFDKVFDPFCSTQKVYEEGARDVALSAMNGINSTIFAYGQTSSGKTFTMRGITENAVKDIYDQIKSTMEKEFVLKFSALEIYNETVADLLNRESGSLRLLDDPEKGTIVEKLTEEVVIDAQHLRHLINICEAQRQVGDVLPRNIFCISTYTLAYAMIKWMSVQMVDKILIALSTLILGDTEKYGIKRPSKGPIESKNNEGRTPVLDMGALKKIRSGGINVVSAGIKKFSTNKVEFMDGKVLDIDSVILATGYRSNVRSWLEENEFFSKNGTPVNAYPNAWKGENGLYAVGFTNRGLAGASLYAMKVSEELGNIWKKDGLF